MGKGESDGARVREGKGVWSVCDKERRVSKCVKEF